MRTDRLFNSRATSDCRASDDPASTFPCSRSSNSESISTAFSRRTSVWCGRALSTARSSPRSSAAPVRTKASSQSIGATAFARSAATCAALGDASAPPVKSCTVLTTTAVTLPAATAAARRTASACCAVGSAQRTSRTKASATMSGVIAAMPPSGWGRARATSAANEPTPPGYSRRRAAHSFSAATSAVAFGNPPHIVAEAASCERSPLHGGPHDAGA